MTIDVRCRPPFKGFLQQFANPAGTKAFTAKFSMAATESVMQSSEALMLQEMDEAGIDYAIATGRKGHFRYSIDNDDIVDLVDHYEGRFFGAMGVDCANVPDALKEIDKYMVNGKLIAISMEPGACPVPIYGNDRRLYPIYEMCQAHNIPVIIMLGGRAGPTLSFSNPEIISTIANDFPKANFLVSHGGWPWVQPVLGAAFWQENIWLCPDMYLMNNTGAADYVIAANTWLQDRFLFGSAYPLMPIVESVDRFKSLFDPAVLPKLLWQNAARLFNLNLSEKNNAARAPASTPHLPPYRIKTMDKEGSLYAFYRLPSLLRASPPATSGACHQSANGPSFQSEPSFYMMFRAWLSGERMYIRMWGFQPKTISSHDNIH